MRKVILQMQITLDGFVSGPNGELDWIDFDPAMGEEHYALAEHADAALMGHTVYGIMSGYWPAVANHPEGSSNEVAYAKLVNAMKKIVFSTKEETMKWSNASQCLIKDGDDLAQKVLDMKKQPGGYLLLNGGIQTAQTFITHDLVDEYRLDLCPVALGEGKALFTDRTNLKLVNVKQYDSGAMTLTYLPKR